MKKLMIAIAAAMVSVVASANAVKWSVSLVTPSVPGDGATTTTDYAGYLFIASDTSSTFDTFVLSEVTTALAGGDLTVLDDAISHANANQVIAQTGNANFPTTTLTETLDTGNTITGFLIIMDADESHYLVADVGGKGPIASKQVASGTSAYTLAFGSQASNTAWQAVGTPEPTSAMLLLLGFAGLALRRRRA